MKIQRSLAASPRPVENARMQKCWRYLILVIAFVGSIAVGYVVFKSAGADGAVADAPEVDWRRLGDLDYLTGKGTPDLEALDGKVIKIPGFMVPLEDSQKAVTEFLLVPTPQACIHVPAPPPNQMILIDMEKGHEAKVEYGPIWVYGTLHLKSKKHQYGESSYTMDGLGIEPYR
jgi:hypothetical protein